MIRPADVGDAAALAAVSIEVWVSTYIKNGMTAAFADYVLAEFTIERLADAINAPDVRFWVSCNGDGIDGYIKVSQGQRAPVSGCGEVEISTLYVQPRHQGRGIGAALVRTALADVDVGIWLKVNSENRGAIKFYNALGFERVGVTDFKIGEEAYANDVMAIESSR